MSWEYHKIGLNDVTRRTDDIDLLCDAGGHGWELVTITANNIAYLKREVVEDQPKSSDHPTEMADNRSGEVKPKFRNPATGDTWSGRGRMATWLKTKQDAGEDIENYRVEA